MQKTWGALVLAGSLATAASGSGATQAAQTYKGLEIAVSGVERATNVSLTDCPAGANIVRGVIRPGDPMEFATTDGIWGIRVNHLLNVTIDDIGVTL